MRLSIGDIVAATSGQLLQGSGATTVNSFTNDSRRAHADSCFVALRAERDGHEFVADAVAAGSTALLVEHPVRVANTVAVIEVPNTLAALADLGRAVRARQLNAATVVGITGSTGKTSTKDLTLAALSGSRLAHANVESFNNEIGLPLTLLHAPPDCEVVITEMGARFAGNIAELCSIARPDIGAITNIGTAHAEHLGGRDGIVATKGELLAALEPSGVAVIGSGDYDSVLRARSGAPVLTVGTDAGCDVRVEVVGLDADLRPLIRAETPWGRIECRVGLRGAHQATNAGIALAIAHHVGVDVDTAASRLIAAHGSAWRMDLIRTDENVAVLNDAYNANPASMAAAIESLRALEVDGRRIAVLGAMRELGAIAQHAHETVGQLLADHGVDVLIGVGVEGGWIASGAHGVRTVEVVPDAAAATAVVRALVCPGDAVLVKASRALGLEAVAAALVSDGKDRSQ